ncbi:MAG: hypothetical protein IT342_17175 [Candidatus Melainabacteria bacterium]|nr:hypothetical protein [Candidatus Melainabacteria bacterium]
MAKKKGKSDKKQDAGVTNASDSAQAELVRVMKDAELVIPKKSAELSSAEKSTEVASAKMCNDLVFVSCMEVASTPCTNIADSLGVDLLDAEESPELWADLANAPCTDIVTEPCRDSTETFTTIQQSEGGVSDLVTQQLRQMFEEGGATATCASAGSFTGTHTMNLNVKAGAVDMNLSTVTEANQELLELKTQIDLLQRLLEESGVRLEVANQRIGSLEAEIALKDKLLNEKLEQGSWLRSLFGL